jgi:phosphoribosyl 1,2-cyclic phosphodiesterase
MECACLASGSDGNALLVRGGGTTVLVDCGLSAAALARALAGLGVHAREIGAVLVSHEHSDHVSGLGAFVRRHRVPVYLTRGTARALRDRGNGRLGGAGESLCCVRAGEPMWVGAFEVVPFSLSHDAAEPVGFRFQTPSGVRLGLITDTGEATREAEEALAGCHLLGLESNHCADMLARGPYPAFLKRRILSERGHLSNAAAADLLERLTGDGLRTVLALHISKVNNTPSLARNALEHRLRSAGSAARVHTPAAETCVWHAVG